MLFPLIIYSISACIALAILVNSNRPDLAGYALVAALLMGIGQMAFFVGSEILSFERRTQLLEVTAVTPAGYFLPLLSRIATLTSIGALGFATAYAIALFGFGIQVRIHHPFVFASTTLVTVFAAATTALVTTTVYSFGRTPRTYQNALPGPLYLLGGVLVPVAYLPEGVQPLSRAIFFSWSADLLRDSLSEPAVAAFWPRVGMIVLLGAIGGGIGAILLRRMFAHLKAEGTLGI